MAPSRHNLSRRALLGAGVGAWVLGGGAAVRASGGASAAGSFAVPFGVSLSNPVLGGAEGDVPGPYSPSPGEQGKGGLRQAQPERREDDPGEAGARWARTLAAYRRCERRIAAFKAGEALLPAERRAFPACRPLERRFGDLDDRRFAMLRRLFRQPAPDLAALALKLELAVEDRAWELTGAEDCLAAIAADARRLAGSDRAGG